MGIAERQTTELGNQKRELILRAAESEFEIHGFGGARMQRIADRAGVPKANIHYYFSSKEILYDAVLSHVVDLWNQALSPIDVDADPAAVLEQYVRMKVEFTRLYPSATRIFAIELLNGWRNIGDHLENETRSWTISRVAEIERWIKQKRIRPIDPYHLIFMIWATTQHYAEAETQVKSIYRKKQLKKADYDQFADTLVTMVLRICGLDEKS